MLASEKIAETGLLVSFYALQQLMISHFFVSLLITSPPRTTIKMAGYVQNEWKRRSVAVCACDDCF